MIPDIRVGAGPDDDLVLNLVADTGVDFSLVTSAVIRARDGRGNTFTWDATISNQSANAVTVTHAFQVTDLVTKGRYTVYAKMAKNTGGFYRSVPEEIIVGDEFQV